MEGSERDGLVLIVPGNTVEIDEFLRGDEVFCKLGLNFLELGTHVNSILCHMAYNDAQLHQNIHPLRFDLISLNELVKGSNLVSLDCHLIEQVGVEMGLGLGENFDELFLELVRNVIVPNQVKDFDWELLVVLLAALFGVLGNKSEELALLIFVILQV